MDLGGLCCIYNSHSRVLDHNSSQTPQSDSHSLLPTHCLLHLSKRDKNMCQFHPGYCFTIRVAPTSFVGHVRTKHWTLQSVLSLETKKMLEGERFWSSCQGQLTVWIYALDGLNGKSSGENTFYSLRSLELYYSYCTSSRVKQKK